ncbi:tRNA 2-selenouridine(34) synthase MnmH [Clostridiaceae bacterium 35-E11]
MQVINIEKALEMQNVVFIDVRSPSEYKEATIYGAINIPILDDIERAMVGTIYRMESVEQATVEGLKYVAPKLPSIYAQIKEYSKKYDRVIIFCWRGGMRSKSTCDFLDMLRITNVYQLIGGYKAYRRYVVNFLKNSIDPYQFIMLHGLTGVGKTHILERLETIGYTVLNLERMAKNSGSVFGDIVFEGKPPSQKMFETYLFNCLYFTKNKYIFVESESKRIGSVQVPDSIYNQMISGYHILIHTTMNNRVEIILNDYVGTLERQDDKIKKAVHHLRKRLGNDPVDKLLKKIEQKDYISVIKYLIEYYYDPLYRYSIDKYEHYDLIIEYVNMDDAISQIIEFFTKNF